MSGGLIIIIITIIFLLVFSANRKKNPVVASLCKNNRCVAPTHLFIVKDKKEQAKRDACLY